MSFSDYFHQQNQRRLVQQQIIQEALFLNQEISLKRTEKSFAALCLFLLTQAYTIPIIPIGPWAAWPCLTDLAIVCSIVAFLIEKKHLPPPSASNRNIFNFLPLVLLVCLISYLIYLFTANIGEAKGANFGLFQIYRLIEFFWVFWFTARIPLDAKRIETLRKISIWVFLFVCLGIVLTFFAIVPLTLVGAHLPKSISAGPWSYYAKPRIGEGWGTIGYNHSYVSAQVILLFGFYLHLSPNQSRPAAHPYKEIYLVITIVTTFLTGSRNGFAAMLVFAFFKWIMKPSYIFTLLGAFVISLPFYGILQLILSSSQSTDGFILDRQLTIFDAGNRHNLSGRDEIWQHRLDFLNSEPVRWIFGSGFGSAVDSGNNAHMLPLQITVETGLVGLAIFLFLSALILLRLYRFEFGSKDFFLTSIVLAISCISQETFYPVPALGHFVGFYLFCLSISLRDQLTVEPSWLLKEDNLSLLKTPLITNSTPFLIKDNKVR